jgi:hypothetical protein
MTATLTPASSKDMLSAYRQDQRAAALQNGAPTVRAEFPGMPFNPDGIIYRTGAGLTYKPTHDKARSLDHATLTMLLTDEEKVTAVADRPTLDALQAIGSTQPDEEYGSIAKRLKALNSLPASVRMPVLTEALAYRYWLPEGKDESSYADWAAAFNATGPTMSLSMRKLIELATDGRRSKALKYDKVTDGLRKTETKLMDQCVWSNISSDVQVFGMLEGYSSRMSAMRTIDPGLLELHVLDGRVCRVRPMNETHGDFSAAVSQPFKFKESRPLRITDGFGVATTTLTELRYGSGELHAVFEQPSEGGSAMVHGAKRGTVRLYVAEDAPFMPGARTEKRRWLSGPSVERVSDRTVPLDVILAGAPVS